MEIQINNQQRLVKISKKEIKSIVETILREETKKKFQNNFEISLNFVKDKKIKEINLKYLSKNSPTDVIAFALTEGKFKNIHPEVLGDIFISAETAVRQAKTYNQDLNQELILYLIHGMLHILKYDDIDPKKRKIMKEKEQDYLKKFKKLNIHLITK
jgi:probable rRNA maturation factor